MEKDQGYYEAPAPRPEDVPSLYAEMLRSRDYAENRYDSQSLLALGEYWTHQLDSEYRSPRAKEDIHRLIGRISFELVMLGKDAYETRTDA